MNFADLEMIEFTEDMGTVEWPDGFGQVLAGKTVEEQLRHYKIASSRFEPLSYYLADWAMYAAYRILSDLDAFAGWEKIILRDGLVVGFVRQGRRVLPYHVVDSDIDSDNNGAGYKEWTTYYYLVCVPEQLDRKPVVVPPFGAPASELTLPVIPYDGSRGENPLPEGFAERLNGKPLSAQMYYFAISDYYPGFKKAWVDEWEKYHEYIINDLCNGRSKSLPFRDFVEALIVQDGRIVGVRVRLQEGAVGDAFADLYPYEDYRYEIVKPYYRHPQPEHYQLTCVSLPG